MSNDIATLYRAGPLPTDTPTGYAHIIDGDRLDESYVGLKIIDMVVTVLYKHSPQTLALFSDTSQPFSFRCTRPPAQRANLDTLQSSETPQRSIVGLARTLDWGGS